MHKQAGSNAVWRMADGIELVLDRPRVMAILNVTPDSFSDGGRLSTPIAAAEAAARAVVDGADLLDIGAESTRPGAQRVAAGEQLARLIPSIRAIRERIGPSVPMTVDTTRAEVAAGALEAGATAINDVSAGTDDPQMLPLAARRRVGVVLMHRLRPPEGDSYSDRYAVPPDYGDVVAAVGRFLAARAKAAQEAGVEPAAIVLDPGLGFGKSVADNLALIARTGDFVALGWPILSGISRKSFVARVAGLGPDTLPAERVEPSVALAVSHLHAGARIFRVHDVIQHVEALRVAWAAWTGRASGDAARSAQAE